MIDFGQNLKQELQSKWIAPSYYFHLQPGGHISALKAHLNNKYFIHLDIKEFFGQISRNRVARNLKKYYSYKKALHIADLSTVITPNVNTKHTMLPFGFVQSPILASISLINSRLGKVLHALNNNSLETKVSVYMDDIIISGNSLEKLDEQLKLITLSASKSRLPLNSVKQEGPQTTITAFNIELSFQSLIISEERYEEFKTVILSKAPDSTKIGILKYTSTVNQLQTKELSKYFNFSTN